MTKIGDLKHRFTFSRRALDANGDRAGAYTDGPPFSRWAAAQWLRGGETVQAQRLQGLQPVVLTVRTETLTRAVDNSWRAVGVTPEVAGQVFNILSAAPSKDPAFLDILAQADGSTGGP